MLQPGEDDSAPMDMLRRFALRYPGAEEGIACAGTSLETRTVMAQNKAFLFLGGTDVRLKLHDSLPDAIDLAAKEPDRCKAGDSGWVKLTLRGDDHPPLELLERWIDESYRLLAPKKLVASLPAGGELPGESTASTHERAHQETK